MMKLFKNDLGPEFIYNKNDAEIYYKHCFLNKDEADDLFVKILVATPWDKNHITLFGKKHLIPRMESWHGDGNYTYSGIKHEAKGWTPELAFVKKRIEKFIDITGRQGPSTWSIGKYETGKENYLAFDLTKAGIKGKHYIVGVDENISFLVYVFKLSVITAILVTPSALN